MSTTIDMLDQEGIEALSMRKLGARLGTAATSVYWHVGNKANLVVLASDQIWDSLDLPAIDAKDWRSSAVALALESYALLTEHPWVLDATTIHFAYGPGHARYQNYCYSVFETAGFRGAELDLAGAVLSDYVAGKAIGKNLENQMLARLSAGDEGKGQLAELVQRAEAIAGEFPRLKARIDAQRNLDLGAIDRDAFAYGIDVILDGLESRL